MTIACPACERRLQASAELAGKPVQCPMCSHIFEASHVEVEWPLPVLKLELDEPLVEPPLSEANIAALPTLELVEEESPLAFPRPAAATRLQERQRHNRGMIAGFAGVFLFVGMIVAMILQVPVADQRRFDHGRIDMPHNRQELVAAFAKEAPVEDQQLVDELRPLFRDLGNGIQYRRSAEVVACFDADRMADEVVALGVPEARNGRFFADGVRRGIDRVLESRAGVMSWQGSEVKHIRRLPDNELAIIVRHHCGEGQYFKTRWWLTRRGGSWKVYDFEDLNSGLRASIAVGSLTALGPDQVREIARAAQTLHDAMAALAQEDRAKAERLLNEIKHVKLPPQLDAVRWLAKASVAVEAEDFGKTLDCVARARMLHADMPALDLVTGRAHNGLGEWEKALPHLESYRDLLGEDPVTLCDLALSLRGVGRFPEAAALYRKALDLWPAYSDAFVGLCYSVDDEDANDDIGLRFARLVHKRECFDICAPSLAERRIPGVLFELARAMERFDPRHPGLRHYLALGRVSRDEIELAVPLFRQALADEPDAEKRETHTTQFLNAMGQRRRYQEGYQALADGRAAFRVLARQCRWDDDELEGLLALHARRHADDPLLHFYRGELLLRYGRPAEADVSFQAGMKNPPDADELSSWRHSRVQARYATGQHLAAYAEIDPREETLQQLAELFFHDGRLKELQDLLDKHAVLEPDSDVLLQQRLRLQISQGQVAAAIERYRAAVQAEVRDEPRRTLTDIFLREMWRAGQVLPAYEAAPDARAAFRTLLALLTENDEDDEDEIRHARVRPENAAAVKKLIDLHRLRHGDDPWLLHQLAQEHIAAKAWDQAASLLQQGFDKAADEDRYSLRYQLVHALYQAGKIAEAYGCARNAEERTYSFQQLASLLVQDRKGVELEELIALHRPHATDQADLLFQQARVCFLTRKPADAIPFVQQAYREQKQDWQRRMYVQTLVDEMRKGGLPLEGYRAAPDQQVAFRKLAGDLLGEKKVDELARLVTEYLAKHRADAWVHYYLGQVELSRGDLARAEEQFRLALERAPRDRPWPYREGLFRVRIKTGRVRETVEQFRHDRLALEELVRLVTTEEKKPEHLEAIIAWRRQVSPKDSVLIVWEVELAMLRGDHAGALRQILQHRHGVLDRPRHRGKCDEYLVRCLVKLKSHEEAVHVAEAIVSRAAYFGELLVLAHAATGNVPRTLAVMEQLSPTPYLINQCYEDEDLGALLKSPAFESFRQKYPQGKLD